MAQSVTLLGCGDVGPIHGPIEHYGSLVRDALLAADIRFAQVDIFRRCLYRARLAFTNSPSAAEPEPDK